MARIGSRGRLGPAAGAAAALWLALVAACADNIGRVFDPGSRGKKGAAALAIVPPPAGGVTRKERPRVLRVAPEGSGWAPTTPVFVLFSESMLRDSLVKPTNADRPDHLYVRVKGTTQAIPGTYDLLLGGRLLVFRPQTGFPPQSEIEIVAGPRVRDVDRAILQGGGVLATFRANAPPTSGPRVVFRVPEDRDKGVFREDPVLVGFSVPVDPSTVNKNTLFLREAGKTDSLPAALTYPLRVQGAPDPRLVALEPSSPLPGAAKIELRYTKGIKAAGVALDPGTKDPPVAFTTAAPLALTKVAVGNPPQGFPDRVNIDNLATLQVAVGLPAGARAGDTIRLRIYGRDPQGKSSTDLSFLEFEFRATKAGPGTETLSLAGRLGSVGAAVFADGDLTLAARLVRGAEGTGYVLSPRTVLDTVRPSLVSLGPPAKGFDVPTDLNAMALTGKASERLGGLTLAVGGQNLGLFASSPDGRFMSQAFFLGRKTAPEAFSLNLVDEAGNLSAGAVQGRFLQRGFVTGSVAGGTLVVEAYDAATLDVLQGVTVLVEPGMPQKPASGRASATTGADGRATFTGLTAASYSITLLKDGYHVFSLLDTKAGHVSLPLEPLSGATAKLDATLGFTPLPGILARAGVNVLADPDADFAAATGAASPTALKGVAVRPMRPLLLTAFAGRVPPVIKPTYAFYGVSLGASSAGAGRNLAPPEPVGPGGSYALSLPLTSALNTFANLAAPFALDLTKATGLDTSKLAGDPTVLVQTSLGGFPGMVLSGSGFASGAGGSWNLDASYSLTLLVDFAALGPITWLSSTAVDQNGNLVRHRALVADTFAGTVTSLADPLGIPAVTPPSGTVTGSPAVTVADRLAAGTVANTLAFRRVVAVDPGGRRWDLLYVDEDGTGSDGVQFPDLSGTLAGKGLQAGTWKIRARDLLLLAPGLSASEWNYEDLLRLELGSARSAEVSVTVQ